MAKTFIAMLNVGVRREVKEILKMREKALKMFESVYRLARKNRKLNSNSKLSIQQKRNSTKDIVRLV